MLNNKKKSKCTTSFPVGSVGKESACNEGDARDMGWEGPLENFFLQGISAFLPGESDGQRSLVTHSLWGRLELDTTEATEHASALQYLHVMKDSKTI